MCVLLAIVAYVEVDCFCDCSNAVLGPIDVADSSGFRKLIGRDVEMFNYVWSDEILCRATVYQCADFRMKGSGMELDEGAD